MAINAWLRSLPIVIGGPILLWCILSFVAWISTGDASAFVGYAGVAIFAILASGPTHFCGYALFGLPLFLFGYSRHGGFIWKPGVSILFGIVLGSMLAASGLVGVVGMPDIRDGLMGYMAGIGVFYGIWSAVWARRFSPKTPSSIPSTPESYKCCWLLGS